MKRTKAEDLKETAAKILADLLRPEIEISVVKIESEADVFAGIYGTIERSDDGDRILTIKYKEGKNDFVG